MISRSQKIRLGVFVAVAVALLLSILVFILGATWWADQDSYEVRYDISVSGLEVGAPVKYNGVRVGRVERIWIDPDQVSQTVIAISLQKGTPVKENARAVLNVQGITGLRFIELAGGTSEAKTIHPGATIEAGTSVVDKLTGQAEALSIKAELLINQMLALTGSENRALVSDVLERVGSLTVTLDKLLLENKQSIDAILQNTGTAAMGLARTLEEVRLVVRESNETIVSLRKRAEAVFDGGRVQALIDDARGAMQDVRARLGQAELGQTFRTLDQLIRRLDTLAEKVDLVVSRSREDLQSTLRYLSEATENLRDFSRLIREDPSRLLRGQEKRGRELP